MAKKTKEFTLPAWERIWTELNKFVEDIPTEEVEQHHQMR